MRPQTRSSKAERSPQRVIGWSAQPDLVRAHRKAASLSVLLDYHRNNCGTGFKWGYSPTGPWAIDWGFHRRLCYQVVPRSPDNLLKVFV